MSKLPQAQNIRNQHAQLRKLLERFEVSARLPMSSDMAHELMGKLFHCVVQHIKAECELLREICASLGAFYSYDKHATGMLAELTRFNFEVLSRSNKTIATILPQIRNLIDAHEDFHVHAILLEKSDALF